jgi:hypothetical protein
MNLFYYSALAGLIGSVLTNGLTYIFRFIRVKTSLPWEIAANIFLNPHLIHTPAGVIIGLIATVALSTGTALLIAYILKWTGSNMAWLKGIICADAFGFTTLGLFTRLLNIWPQIRNEPGTNLIALITLSVLGITQALLLRRWQRNLV